MLGQAWEKPQIRGFLEGRNVVLLRCVISPIYEMSSSQFLGIALKLIEIGRPGFRSPQRRFDEEPLSLHRFAESYRNPLALILGPRQQSEKDRPTNPTANILIEAPCEKLYFL